MPVGGESADPIVKFPFCSRRVSCSFAYVESQFDEEPVVIVYCTVVGMPSGVGWSAHVCGLGGAQGGDSRLYSLYNRIVYLLCVAVETISEGGVHVVQFGREFRALAFVGQVDVGWRFGGLCVFWRRYLG